MPTGAGSRLGVYGALGVAQEATLGTYLTITTAEWMPFISESLKHSRPKIKSEEIVGGRDFMRFFEGPDSVSGAIEANFNVSQDAVCYIIKQAMGGTVASSRPVVNGGYVHTFFLGDMENNDSSVSAADTKGLSVCVKRGETTTASWAYAGLRVNALTIKGEYGKPVTMSAELVGTGVASLTTWSSTPAVAFTAVLPLMFHGITIGEADAIASITSQTVHYFQSFEWKLENGIAADDDSRDLGSRFFGVLPAGRRTVSLKLKQRFDTTTAWDKYLAGTITAVRIAMLGTQTITAQAGDTVYSCLIDLPHCFWEEAQPNVGGPGLLSYDLSVGGIQYNTSTNYSARVYVANNTAGY